MRRVLLSGIVYVLEKVKDKYIYIDLYKNKRGGISVTFCSQAGFIAKDTHKLLLLLFVCFFLFNRVHF